MRTTTTLLTTAILAAGALARTDLSGCVSSATVKYGGASLIWYVPGTGEICEFLDCGGGRAPPKTTVPGCAAYSGTATYSPDYLPGYGPDATPTAASSSSAAAAVQSPSVTAAPSLSSAAVSSAAAASSTASSNDSGDDGEDSTSESASASASDSDSLSFSVSVSSSAYASTGASTVTAITTPGSPVNPLNGASTPSGTPAASTPASFTGAAGRIEAAAGVAVGGVVAALAWL